VILINLLPHREAARKRRVELFNVSLGLAFLVGGLLAGLIFLWYQAQITDQQEKNQVLQSEIIKFDVQIKDIAGLEAEISALKARQQAVEDLQADRNLPVHLLTQLVQQLPDGVFIINMRQENQSVTLQGVAQSNERVSELLRNLGNNTPWFSKPELVEIVAGTIALTPREQRRVANFTIRVALVRASEAVKAVAPGNVAPSTSAQK
jgi:type IV pilus assembly protein PilN